MNKFITKSTLYILGVPIILLVLFLVINNNTQKDNDLAYDFNPYLKPLPSKYIAIVEKNKNQDSIFFSTIIETNFTRELVVLKSFPDDLIQKTSFTIKLFKPNKNSNTKKKVKPTIFKITSLADIYNYKGKTYSVNTKKIPYLDLEKIVVKQNSKDKTVKVWRTEIASPFKPLNHIEINKIQSSDSLKTVSPNPYRLIYSKLLAKYNIQYLPYSILEINDQLVELNGDLKEYTTENKLTIGLIDKPNMFWNLLNEKSEFIGNEIVFDGQNSDQAVALLKKYLNGEIRLNEAFNLEKLAYYFAIDNLFSKKCINTLHFVFTNNKFEPFFVDSNCLGKTSDYVKKPRIVNPFYVNQLVLAYNEISQLNIYDALSDSKQEFIDNQVLINAYYPTKIFDDNLIKVNQQIIKKSLNPSTAIKPELISLNNNKLVVSILNLSNYPIVINELNHLTKKNITNISNPTQILSGQTDTIEVNLPRSFENLFVSKKKKNTGFILSKHIYELFLGYKIGELNAVHYSNIIPYQSKHVITDDLLRVKSTIEGNDKIIINRKQKTITFKNKFTKIDSPLILPKGFTFVLKPGTTVDIVEGGKIISYAALNFKGTIEQPIKIGSSDKKGQGILVMSDGEDNKLNHTIFDHLSNLSHGYWSITGAVNFYESPVILNSVTVSNNRCEDALNIIRTHFSMNNCTLLNTQSDAFDGDFVEGTIRGSKFINLGNDAIDVSGSDIKIIDVQISEAGDKGLSAGENSKMTINNVTISTSEIAVAGKDLSIINATNLTIKNTKLAFTAFQKKPEFGPSEITVNKVQMDNVEIDYLVESTSSLLVDGKKVETSQNVKDRMYGAEFGVSSDETRNKQYKN